LPEGAIFFFFGEFPAQAHLEAPGALWSNPKGRRDRPSRHPRQSPPEARCRSRKAWVALGKRAFFMGTASTQNHFPLGAMAGFTSCSTTWQGWPGTYFVPCSILRRPARKIERGDPPRHALCSTWGRAQGERACEACAGETRAQFGRRRRRRRLRDVFTPGNWSRAAGGPKRGPPAPIFSGGQEKSPGR